MSIKKVEYKNYERATSEKRNVPESLKKFIKELEQIAETEQPDTKEDLTNYYKKLDMIIQKYRETEIKY